MESIGEEPHIFRCPRWQKGIVRELATWFTQEDQSTNMEC